MTLSTDDPLLFHMSDDALLEGEKHGHGDRCVC